MSGNLAGILGNIETHAHLTLRAQIVSFIRLDRSNDAASELASLRSLYTDGAVDAEHTGSS